MALALWAAAGPGTVAWVNVDELDNQPGIFWSYVVAALRRSGVALQGGVARRAGPGTPGTVFVLWLAAALAAQDPPVTLVLDDLHLLTDPTVVEGLDYVLRNVGPGLRLLVSARMNPLPLHRYPGRRADRDPGQRPGVHRGRSGLLLARHGITLPADSLQCLTRRTEGWAAGLRLAAISMRAHPDPGPFASELVTEDSAVTGYLTEEVLDVQPPEVRDVLLNTSILEDISAEARRRTGRRRAGREDLAGPGARERVCPAGRAWPVLLPPVARGGAAAEAAVRASGPGGPAAPAGRPVV